MFEHAGWVCCGASAAEEVCGRDLRDRPPCACGSEGDGEDGCGGDAEGQYDPCLDDWGEDHPSLDASSLSPHLKILVDWRLVQIEVWEVLLLAAHIWIATVWIEQYAHLMSINTRMLVVASSNYLDCASKLHPDRNPNAPCPSTPGSDDDLLRIGVPETARSVGC